MLDRERSYWPTFQHIAECLSSFIDDYVVLVVEWFGKPGQIGGWLSVSGLWLLSDEGASPLEAVSSSLVSP